MGNVAKLKKTKKFHKESLMQIPLVRQAVEHNEKYNFICKRSVDNQWFYSKTIPLAVAGFNPATSKIFLGHQSKLAEWLKKPQASVRPMNTGDSLVYEVLFFVHDYLHLWAYQAIQKLKPELGFGVKKISTKNFEDFVFCHLLTEAVAVVGLDYWQLCETSVNEYCPIGTTIESLAVNYSGKLLDEYRLFNPEFDAQTPDFFCDIAKFYCSGDFMGFDVKDLAQSPVIMNWLEHELSYGESQRVYTRHFLSQFFDNNQSLSFEELKKPIKVNKKWQKNLITELSHLLWDKVKNDNNKPLHLSRFKSQWKTSPKETGDFRFYNLNAYKGDFDFLKSELEEASSHSRRFFLYQFVSCFDYNQFSTEEVSLIKGIVERCDLEDAFAFFKKCKMLKANRKEPTDILILN